MRFADAKADFEVARAVVVSVVTRIWADFMQRQDKLLFFVIRVSASSLMQTKSAMLIRMQASRPCGLNDRFISAASAVAAAPPPAPSSPSSPSSVFASSTDRPRRRKEEARARLIYTLSI